MFSQIEHFVYGTREQLKRFCADLPAEIEVVQVPGGLVLREVLENGNDVVS